MMTVSPVDSKVAFGSAELKYDYKDLFDCALKATYYHWDLSQPKAQDEQTKQVSLALKPELEVL